LEARIVFRMTQWTTSVIPAADAGKVQADDEASERKNMRRTFTVLCAVSATGTGGGGGGLLAFSGGAAAAAAQQPGDRRH